MQLLAQLLLCLSRATNKVASFITINKLKRSISLSLDKRGFFLLRGKLLKQGEKRHNKSEEISLNLRFLLL